MISKSPAILCVLVLGCALSPCRTAYTAGALKSTMAFLAAQQCHVNGTVDYGCFQKNLGRFEQFVLQDEAGWLQKSIVAESLVKTYDALHISSPAEAAVRAKERIYSKANEALDKRELGEIDDCRDEASPDGCLKTRYCFKESYIKVKNVLVTNEPERFQAEIRWFDREIKGHC
jgi:hypothetical protein